MDFVRAICVTRQQLRLQMSAGWDLDTVRLRNLNFQNSI